MTVHIVQCKGVTVGLTALTGNRERGKYTSVLFGSLKDYTDIIQIF